MIRSCYIHIPFCKKICSYCDFCKLFYDTGYVLSYLDSLDEKIRADNREVLEKIKETWAAWRLVADVKKISKEELENPYYHLKPLVEYQKNFWRDMETVFDELREEIDNNAKMYSEVMTKRIQGKVLHSAMERISLFF